MKSMKNLHAFIKIQAILILPFLEIVYSNLLSAHYDNTFLIDLSVEVNQYVEYEHDIDAQLDESRCFIVCVEAYDEWNHDALLEDQYGLDSVPEKKKP